MPDIPLVRPDSSVAVAPAVGVQRINLTRGNPALEEGQEGAAHISNMVLHMQDMLNHQKMNEEIQNAQSERITADTASLTKASGINDPGEKQQFLIGEYNKNAAQVVKDHPNIPGLDGAMNEATAKQLQALAVKTIEDKHTLAVTNINNISNQNLLDYNNAQTPDQRNQIVGRTHQFIQDSVTNGIIHQEDANKYLFGFNYATRKIDVDKLVQTDPVQAQTLLASGKAGLNAKDTMTAINTANAKATYNMMEPDRVRKAEQMQILGQIQNGSYKGNPWDDFQHGKITAEMFHQVTGTAPTNAGLRNDMMKQIDNYSGDAVGLEAWKNQVYLRNYDNMSSEDHSMVMGDYALKQKELGTDEGKKFAKDYSDLKDFNFQINHNLYSFMGNKLNKDKAKDAINILSGTMSQAKAAKTSKERDEIWASGRQQLYNIQHMGTAPASINVRPLTVPHKDATELLSIDRGGPAGIAPASE
jgi:hypothetical protein